MGMQKILHWLIKHTSSKNMFACLWHANDLFAHWFLKTNNITTYSLLSHVSGLWLFKQMWIHITSCGHTLTVDIIIALLVTSYCWAQSYRHLGVHVLVCACLFATHIFAVSWSQFVCVCMHECCRQAWIPPISSMLTKQSCPSHVHQTVELHQAVHCNHVHHCSPPHCTPNACCCNGHAPWLIHYKGLANRFKYFLTKYIKCNHM